MISIREPRWKDRTILIADWKIVPEWNDIEITCKDGQGQPRYPQVYRVHGDWLKQFPVEDKNYGKMRVVPLKELLEVE